MKEVAYKSVLYSELGEEFAKRTDCKINFLGLPFQLRFIKKISHYSI